MVSTEKGLPGLVSWDNLLILGELARLLLLLGCGGCADRPYSPPRPSAKAGASGGGNDVIR